MNSLIQEIDHVVIRFSGDSGDGMQLTGTQFSNTSAAMGNDLATFPDYPSEIRAPQGTIAGVSGFQVHFGSVEINTPGDDPDVLVAMNAAALRANLSSLKKGGVIIANSDAFEDADLEKAGYKENPLSNDSLKEYKVIISPLEKLTLEATKELALDNKVRVRCKNFCALGITYYLFDRNMENTVSWIEYKFKSNPTLKDANILALKAGHMFAEKIQAVVGQFRLRPAKISPGLYRQMNGNEATAWGLMMGAQASGLPLFLGSYPITPATDILHELSKHKAANVKTYQAEDEIAGICTAIGAAFGGALATTTTSGPGLCLKSEAIGLAVMYELPLVIVNVQRGGPSTGLPTKTEQSDLNQALFGRNGESPVIVVAASRPNDCFHMAYEACRLALEHMHPVILLTDGYIANGAEPWKIPDIKTEYKKISVNFANSTHLKNEKFLPYLRDEKTLVRPWAIPGMKGFEHRVGGLEKENITGAVCYAPENHQQMTDIRQEKINRVTENIPPQEIYGDEKGDLLVLSWGGTYGIVYTAVDEVRKMGKKVSHVHLKYINPMPKNLAKILSNFKSVLIPELNLGQMRDLINARYHINAKGLNKVQGQPFKVQEVVSGIMKELENIK